MPEKKVKAEDKTKVQDMVWELGLERTKAAVIEAENRRFSWEKEEDEIASQNIVIRAKDNPWIQQEQGKIRICQVMGAGRRDVALRTVLLFAHDIPKQSGRHIHQGGIGLFCIEGKGYTVTDGVRQDWEAGDMVLLPITKRGCEHQHFNLDPNKPARWVALGSTTLREFIGRKCTQTAYHPDWRGDSPFALPGVEKSLLK